MSIPLPERHLALLWLAAALDDNRTPEAKAARLASFRSDARLAGIRPDAIEAAIGEFHRACESFARHNPPDFGGYTRQRSPAEQAERQTAARAEVERDLFGDALGDETPASPVPTRADAAHDPAAMASRVRHEQSAMTKLAGERR